MPKIRIYNITSFLRPPGFGLDFEGRYIPANPNRPLIIDIPVVPEILERWVEAKWAKVVDADDKTPVTKESEATVTPGTQVNEVAAADLDVLEDDIFDFSVAKEAALPSDVAETMGPAPLQPINQMPAAEQPRAKVTLGSEDKMNMADTVSPIPGDKPRSVDNSDAFTVRAPRHQGPGAVVKSS